MFKKLLGDRDALANAAWVFVLYLIGVIMFGAWVRITHSGAGCGSHWPTCHGEVIPLAPSTETLIEYTHRLTSGLCGIFGLVLLVWAWLKHRASRVFVGIAVTMVFIVFEALIGAGIVLKELVADNDSAARAIIISIHLVNTLMLTGAASLTAWWAGGHALPSWRATKSTAKWLLPLALVGLAITSMAGAVTALGDTLFPVDPTVGVGAGLVAHVREDVSAANHFLVRLRVAHPVIAVVVSAGLVWIANIVRTRRDATRATKSWSWIVMALVGAEVGFGLLNIVLHAPGWLQLGHLMLAQLLWIATLLMGASMLHPRDGVTSA